MSTQKLIKQGKDLYARLGGLGNKDARIVGALLRALIAESENRLILAQFQEKIKKEVSWYEDEFLKTQQKA